MRLACLMSHPVWGSVSHYVSLVYLSSGHRYGYLYIIIERWWALTIWRQIDDVHPGKMHFLDHKPKKEGSLKVVKLFCPQSGSRTTKDFGIAVVYNPLIGQYIGGFPMEIKPEIRYLIIYCYLEGLFLISWGIRQARRRCMYLSVSCLTSQTITYSGV